MTLFNNHHSPSVLFVPGAMSGGWIWEDNFQQFFNHLGADTHAMSFSGHGAPFYQRQRIKFEDYVDECITNIKQFDKPPIVIGHSLGGLIALHAASKVPTQAMILLSPAPITGITRSLLDLGKNSPISLVKFIMAVTDVRVTTLGAPPKGIYSGTCDPDREKHITKQIKSESLLVLSRLLSPPKLEAKALNGDKILFVGATGDAIIPAHEVVKSAAMLNSPTKIIQGMSHTYQAESNWEALANDMVDWLKNIK